MKKYHNPVILLTSGVIVSMAVLWHLEGFAGEIESSMARGGRLYDKWYKTVNAEIPKQPHKLYPVDTRYSKKPAANWRCKECHGWDYRGKHGAYALGKHHSGIKGIDAMFGAETAGIIAILTDASHGYADKLSKTDLADLANFVAKGQVNMDEFIDRASKSAKGDAARGAAYFNTICANCHGREGKQPKDMKPFGAQMSNPWEVLHKILNGQPNEDMPALRALDHQVAKDILAYMATLPKE